MNPASLPSSAPRRICKNLYRFLVEARPQLSVSRVPSMAQASPASPASCRAHARGSGVTARARHDLPHDCRPS